MRIEKITLCNLTSFEGEHVIDFSTEPLRSAGLFAITGDTGAGKSTLLDAICVALYNRTPRLDDTERLERNELATTELRKQAIQASDPRNIMRRGKTSAYSRVIFSTINGERYEAEWICRTKRTGTYDSVYREIRQLSPREKAIASGTDRDVQPHIDTLIGLDYTQFSRTVMLAQGSFATFLQARKKDKSALLEKLTGTEIYAQVSMKIYELANKAENEAKEVESRIEGILHNRLTEEQLQDLTTEIHQKQTLNNSLQEQLERVKEHLHWLETYKEATFAVNDLEKKKISAQKDLLSMHAEQELLARFDSIQPMHTLFETIQVRLHDIDILKESSAQIANQLVKEREKLHTAKGALKTSIEQTSIAEQQIQMRQADLRVGHILTGELRVAEQQVQHIQNLLQKLDTTIRNRQKSISTKQEEINALQVERQHLTLHEQALSVHHQMFDRIDFIRDKLNTFRNETEQNKLDHEELAHLQTEIRTRSETLQQTEKKQQTYTDRLASLKSELLVHRQHNKGRNGSQLQQKTTEIHNRLLSLRHAQLLWQRISSGYDEIEELKATIARSASSLEQTRKNLVQAQSVAETCRNVFNHLNEAYMLSNSENIRRLRKNLKEGTSCPVCGATHHPYHTETERELGELMDNLEKDYNEAKRNAKLKQQEADQIAQDIAKMEGILKADQQHLLQCERTQTDYELEWKDYIHLDKSFAECTPSVNRPARTAMLSMLLDNTQRAEKEISQELETFNHHQNLINQYVGQIEELDAKITAEGAVFEKLRTEKNIYQAQIETIQQRINRSDKVCEQLHRELDEMVTIPAWFSDWEKNPHNFRMHLDELTQDWFSTADKIRNTATKLTEMEQQLHTLEEAQSETNQQQQQTHDEYSALQNQVNEKKEALQKIFGSMTPEQEEAHLQENAERMKQAQMQAQAAFDAINSRVRQLQGRHESLEENRKNKMQELRDVRSQLDLRIERFNATNPPLQFSELKELFTDERDWNKLRIQLDQLKEQLSLATHKLDNARQTILQLQALGGHYTIEQIEKEQQQETARLATLSSQAAQNSATLLTFQTRLRAHEESNRHAAQQQHILDAARDNALHWKRLSDFIGSADGKRFRQLAQSYTFRYLVEHANRHLQQLSPRYQLRTPPGTLFLEVVDRDMFDQTRYVTSLSGGETFVVSLALALGLSSLSTGNVSIGSLFIDEGFGNLDQESLRLVMDALSNLENSQGRKVGIVSHTEQIRQQLYPQIRVRKMPSGSRSCISVV